MEGKEGKAKQVIPVSVQKNFLIFGGLINNLPKSWGLRGGALQPHLMRSETMVGCHQTPDWEAKHGAARPGLGRPGEAVLRGKPRRAGRASQTCCAESSRRVISK